MRRKMYNRIFAVSVIIIVCLAGSLPGMGEFASEPEASAYGAQKEIGDTYDSKFRREMLRLVNQYRREHGLREVRGSVKIREAAKRRAEEALKHPRLAHQRYMRNGEIGRFDTVLKEMHISVRARGWGENLAWRGNYHGNAIIMARKFFEQWKASPSHRMNMLQNRYTVMETAVAYDISRGRRYKAASAQLFLME